MKKVAMTVVGVLALAASANAQGTWYTDQTEWLKYATNVANALYTGPASGSSPVTENGITATAAVGSWYPTTTGVLTTDSFTPVTFTFAGNAFGGVFRMSDTSHVNVNNGIIDFSIDSSLTNVYSLTAIDRFTFLGYISDSASDISVKINGHNANQYVMINRFSSAQGPNYTGSNVAPEPGTFALALTGGCALLGMYIRRRKAA